MPRARQEPLPSRCIDAPGVDGRINAARPRNARPATLASDRGAAARQLLGPRSHSGSAPAEASRLTSDGAPEAASTARPRRLESQGVSGRGVRARVALRFHALRRPPRQKRHIDGNLCGEGGESVPQPLHGIGGRGRRRHLRGRGRKGGRADRYDAPNPLNRYWDPQNRPHRERNMLFVQVPKSVPQPEERSTNPPVSPILNTWPSSIGQKRSNAWQKLVGELPGSLSEHHVNFL